MEILDISRPIIENTRGFTAEPLTKFRLVADISANCPVRVSEITISSHAATHVDAPSHYSKYGQSIESLPLEPFIGPCVVIDVMHVMGKITAQDIKDIKLAERVLIKVRCDPKDFPYLTEDFIQYLAHNNVKLIGTSAISIDHYHSKDIPAHNACLKNNLYIIENLYLDNITPGLYTFIGLPLKFTSVDASPIRAVLIKGNFS